MHRSYIYILIYLIFHFKHDVLITEKPIRGVFNKVLSMTHLSFQESTYSQSRGNISWRSTLNFSAAGLVRPHMYTLLMTCKKKNFANIEPS